MNRHTGHDLFQPRFDAQDLMRSQSFGGRSGRGAGGTLMTLESAERISGVKTLVAATKLQVRDAASYLTSPGASSLDIESPTLRLNAANAGDIIEGSTGNDVYPQSDWGVTDANGTDLGITANRYRNLRIKRILGGVANLIDEAVTIAARTTYYVAGSLEISSGITLTIEAGAILEVG